MTSTLLVRDGELVSVEASVNGRRRVDVRLWHPATDEVLCVDTVDLVSLRHRERVVAGLPEEYREEARQHLMHLADELIAKIQSRTDESFQKEAANLHTSIPDHARERLWESCRHLATDLGILDRVSEAAAAMGVVGADRQVRLVYLTMTSRLLDRPVSLAIKGPSAAGKSFPLEKTLKLFPGEAYYEWTAMSERALAYSDVPLEHRMLVLYEAAGMGGETGSYLLRSLLSEGRLRYMTVEKTAEGVIGSRVIERAGPTGIITTTTRVALHPENETRLLSITVSDSPEQTRKVFEAIASDNRQPFATDPWQDLQRWIGSGGRRVVVPFAKVLAGLLPTTAVRLRRDFGTLLNLIRAHAMLHQANRERDGDGRIVATLADYSIVRDLIADLMAEGVEAAVSRSVRETVEAVRALKSRTPSEGITVSAVAREVGLDVSAASRRVQAATKKGYLKNEEPRDRRPARLVLGEPLPESTEILPTAQRLAEVCGFAVPTGGCDQEIIIWQRGDACEEVA